MRTEIETLPAFDAHVRAHRSLHSCIIQSLDLRGRGTVLETVEVHEALFLGCRLKHRVASSLAARGATIFPRLPRVPFDAYRAHLYTADDLYAGIDEGYPHTPDAQVYDWTRRHRSTLLDTTLAQALHDHFISDALLEAMPIPAIGVGIMGGHSMKRGTDDYRQAAQLGRELAEAGYTVLTGGGPGAMEAANLGACLRGSDADLAAACAELAAAPSFESDADHWARVALKVRQRFDCSRLTLGVPTWFYGHEPPNVFATGIAKYFDNAIREDILLRLSRAGLIYVRGAAGTTQEIFQAVTRNYYATEATEIHPLVLVGKNYWTKRVPAWPLLKALAKDRLMESKIHLVDSVSEAVAVLVRTQR